MSVAKAADIDNYCLVIFSREVRFKAQAVLVFAFLSLHMDFLVLESFAWPVVLSLPSILSACALAFLFLSAAPLVVFCSIWAWCLLF